MQDELFPAALFEALEGLGRRRALEGAGRSPRPRAGHGLPGFEHRAYEPGDSLRRVDWRATARRGSAQVRLREEERGGELLLVLDRSASLTPQDARRDRAQRRLALALGWLALEEGASVILLCGAAPPLRFGGFERRAALQERLAALPPPQGADADGVPGPPPRRSGRRRSVLLSDPWSGAPWWSWWEAATAMDPPAPDWTWASLVLEEEDEPPREGLLLLPVEGGPALELDLDRDPARYRRAWNDWLTARRGRIAAGGARPVELRCGADPVRLLQAAEETGLV